MLVESCCAEEILNLNKNKEYTLISTDLLERVLTDTRLNAQTVKLWQILFNKAKYKKDLSTKMSYSYLSKMLNKSVRTIIRYSKTLVKSGYLKIETNFDESGSQRSNTFILKSVYLSKYFYKSFLKHVFSIFPIVCKSITYT